MPLDQDKIFHAPDELEAVAVSNVTQSAELRNGQHKWVQRKIMNLPCNDHLWLHLLKTTRPRHRICEFIK